MPDAGCQMPDARCQMPDAGCQMPDARCRMPDARCRMPDAGYRMPDAGCQMPDTGRATCSLASRPSVPRRTTAWLLVIAQFVLLTAVVLGPGKHWSVSTTLRLMSWVLVAIAGALGLWAARWLGKGLTPLPLPNGQTDLVTSGPYRWVRHPMYSAVILGMGGIALRSGSWWSAGAWLGLVALLTFKSRSGRKASGNSLPGVRGVPEANRKVRPHRKVAGGRRQVAGRSRPRPGIWHLASGIWYLASGIWHLASGIRYPSSRRQPSRYPLPP